MDKPDRGLSKLQKTILCWLLEQYKHIESTGEKISVWGIDWNPSGRWYSLYHRQNHWTATKRADVSRALRRLEQRGLVIRKNSVSDGMRTTDVLLTTTGREVSERLTKNNFENVSRSTDLRSRLDRI